MALKSDMDRLPDSATIEERLEVLEKLIERTKVLYEQYFLGIQKIAPMQLHRDAERGIRELTQINIRNTALRFRFNTLSQKYGSYNTYWRRIMREIEQGRYIRDISRVGRQAVRRGEEIPEEILAAMPKRMREKIKRDRARMAERFGRQAEETEAEEPAVIRDKPRSHVHTVSADDAAFLDGEVDFDEMFASMIDDAAETVPRAKATAAAAKPAAAPAAKPATAPAAKPAAAPAAKPAAAPAAKPAAAAPARPAARPAAPPRSARAPTPPPTRAPLPGGVTEREARALYDRYVQAKKLVGDSVDNLSYEKIVKTISTQAPKIMKQYGAKAVEFNVVLKDDKVILKAKPKK